jgi:hypothetical protein
MCAKMVAKMEKKWDLPIELKTLKWVSLAIDESDDEEEVYDDEECSSDEDSDEDVDVLADPKPKKKKKMGGGAAKVKNIILKPEEIEPVKVEPSSESSEEESSEEEEEDSSEEEEDSSDDSADEPDILNNYTPAIEEKMKQMLKGKIKELNECMNDFQRNDSRIEIAILEKGLKDKVDVRSKISLQKYHSKY